MMAVARRIESQQLLQQPVDRCRCGEVTSADDVGDALERVVYDHRQMVGRRPVLAAQDDIPPGLRRRLDLQLGVAFAEFAPEEPLRSERPRASHVEPQGGRLPRGQALRGFTRGDGDTAAAMQRRAVGIARAARAENLAARAKAGIDQVQPPQPRQRRRVVLEMLALPARRARECHSEPLHIFEDRDFEFAPAARRIDIFDPKQQLAAAAARKLRVADRGIGVPEMQPAVRRRREAGYRCAGRLRHERKGRPGGEETKRRQCFQKRR